MKFYYKKDSHLFIAANGLYLVGVTKNSITALITTENSKKGLVEITEDSFYNAVKTFYSCKYEMINLFIKGFLAN